MTQTGMLLFAVFGLVLLGMYVAIRRRWLSPTLIASVGVGASIVIMTLIGMAQGNHIYQALFAGFMVGGLFSVGTLAVASFFSSSERRQHDEDAARRVE